MSSYYYWVKKKIGEDSPIGDLARDIMLEQARYRSFLNAGRRHYLQSLKPSDDGPRE